MKKKSVCFLFLLIVILGVYWLLPSRRSRSIIPETKVDTAFIQSGVVEIETGKKNAPDLATSAPSLFFQQQEERMRQAGEMADNEWRAPINFYGKVVDENGLSIEAAQIEFGWNNLTGSPSRIGQSDAQGLFSLQGEQGKFLSVKVNKEGYYAYKPHGEGYFYAGRNDNFVPDANGPVIFQLHKKGMAEPLHRAVSRLKIPLKGQPVKIDLLSARVVPLGGDLELVCLSNYEGRSTNRVFDWHLTLTAYGGITESTKVFDFVAPERDYHPSIEIKMPASMTNGWRETIEKKFFLKLVNGNYARVSFIFFPNNGVLRLETFINPSGSRNLEYDEAVQPKPTVHE